MKNLITLCALAASLTLAACGEDNTNGPVDEPTEPPIQEESMPERPALGAQIDRAGRAAINTALNNTFNGDIEAADAAKDAYNSADPSDWASYTGAFAGSLAILDSLDTVC